MLDVATPRGVVDSPFATPNTGPRAMHMHADFANLRHLQDELELAVAEMKQPQSQRFARYIR